MSFDPLDLRRVVNSDRLAYRFDRDKNLSVFVDFGEDFNAVDDRDFFLLMFDYS